MSDGIRDVLNGANALYKGAKVTLSYMFKKKFCVQYPEEKHPVPPRFRGKLRIQDTIDSPIAPVTWQQAVAIKDKEGEMPPCMEACPDHQHARDYIRFIMQKQYLLGLQISRLTMPYSGCLGRICTRPCEKACRMGEEGEPIAICQLKRFVADWARENVPMDQWDPVVDKVPGAERYHIAIIGGGPAGMTSAHMLGREGYRVTVYERLPILGGYLAVGIPPQRLPRNVLEAENQSVLRYGVEARLNCKVGEDISFMEIYEKHDAVLLASGATTPFMLGIPGENLPGVFKGEYFLEDYCLGQDFKMGPKVVVIGLGLSGVDCARVARTLGGEDVTFVERMPRAYAGAPEHEILEAEAEGIKVLDSVSATQFMEKDGKVCGLEIIKMDPSERDTNGRPLPKPIEGTKFVLPADTVISAISRTANFSYLPTDMGFQFKRNKTIVVDEKFMTHVPGVFASGDAVIGAYTVIAAMGQARFASDNIKAFLATREPRRGQGR